MMVLKPNIDIDWLVKKIEDRRQEIGDLEWNLNNARKRRSEEYVAVLEEELQERRDDLNDYESLCFDATGVRFDEIPF